MATCALIFLASCSKIENNNDPIIGIWAQSQITTSSTTAKQTVRKEWIFNDVYLGRYHEISGTKITVQTDFHWSKSGEIYTVDYRGLEDKPNNVLVIKNVQGGKVYLEKKDGATLAVRE